MVTEHLKIGKKEQRRKAALFNSFHLEPKELGCARTMLLMQGKDILGQSWVPCSWSREVRGDKKSTVCPRTHALPGGGLKHFRRASWWGATNSSISAPRSFVQAVSENYTEVHTIPFDYLRNPSISPGDFEEDKSQIRFMIFKQILIPFKVNRLKVSYRRKLARPHQIGRLLNSALGFLFWICLLPSVKMAFHLVDF